MRNAKRPRCPHPPFTTPHFHDWAKRLGIKFYPYTVAAPDRPADTVLQLDKFDLSPIRGPTPPGVDEQTLIPFSRQTKTWKYDEKRKDWFVSGDRNTTHPFSFYTATFQQLCHLTHVLRGYAPQELCLFSIMLTGQPQHLLLDIDGRLADWPHLAGRVDEVEAETRRLFVLFYQHTFGTEPDMTLWTREESSNPDKISFHINHPGLGFASTRDLFEFVLRWVVWLKANHHGCMLVHYSSGDCLIDQTVYSANRSMRMVYSRKVDGVPLLPSPEASTGPVELCETVWKSLVCCSMPADSSRWLRFEQYVHTQSDGTKVGSSSKKRSREAEAEIGRQEGVASMFNFFQQRRLEEQAKATVVRE